MSLSVTERAARLAGILFLFALTAAGVFLMPAWMLTPDMLPAFGVAILIVGAICYASACGGDPGAIHRRLTFLAWWVLLSSEEFFVRLNQTEDTAQGNFAPQAYAEGMVWVLVFFCGVILLLRRPGSLRGLWRGPLKWLPIYATLCVVSCAFAIQKAFSVAWAFKLCTVVFLLQLCRSQIQDEKSLKAFLNFTLFGVAFLTLVPPVRALLPVGLQKAIVGDEPSSTTSGGGTTSPPPAPPVAPAPAAVTASATPTAEAPAAATPAADATATGAH